MPGGVSSHPQWGLLEKNYFSNVPLDLKPATCWSIYNASSLNKRIIDEPCNDALYSLHIKGKEVSTIDLKQTLRMASVFGDADCDRNYVCAPLTLTHGTRIWPRKSRYITLVKNPAPREQQFPFPGYSDYIFFLNILARYSEKNSYVMNFIRNIVSRVLSRRDRKSVV